jgi:hypothetical protein
MSNNNISKKSNANLTESTSVKNTIAAKNNTKPNTINTINTNNTKKTNATTSNSTQSNNKTNSGSGSSVFGIIILVVVIMLLIISVYWVYTIYSTKTFQSFISADLMSDITDATVATKIPASTIPSSSYSNEYAISFWMNVDDYNYNYGTEKTIISRGSESNPVIVLGDKNNDIIVRVKLQGSPSDSFSKFEDIPIKLPSLNTGNGFIQPAEVNTNSYNKTISSNSNTTDSDINNVPESFKKIGSNNIDYPTIQYTFDNNDSNSNCGYFDLISGNDVNKTNEVKSNGNKLVEGFVGSDDATNTQPNTTNPNNTQPTPTQINSELSEMHGGGICLSDLYSNNDPSIGMCVAKMVPLQKWVSVIVSVYNQIIDIYIDGQLASSCVLKGFPNISTDDINITPNGGFSGKMSRVVFMNTAVTVQQAKDIYYAGPVITYSIFSMIPNWVYWTILVIIIVAIAYSFFM